MVGVGFPQAATPQAHDTGVSPRSVSTRRAAASESVFRKSSSSRAVISTFLIPARRPAFERLAVAGAGRRVLVNGERHPSVAAWPAKPEPRARPAAREASFVVKAWRPPRASGVLRYHCFPHDGLRRGLMALMCADDRVHRVRASCSVQLPRRPDREIVCRRVARRAHLRRRARSAGHARRAPARTVAGGRARGRDARRCWRHVSNCPPTDAADAEWGRDGSSARSPVDPVPSSLRDASARRHGRGQHGHVPVRPDAPDLRQRLRGRHPDVADDPRRASIRTSSTSPARGRAWRLCQEVRARRRPSHPDRSRSPALSRRACCSSAARSGSCCSSSRRSPWRTASRCRSPR